MAAAGDPHATIAGTLCLPEGPAPRAIQLLVPGATYNRIYWDFPGRSYARYAAERGQATFAMDRLDTGESTQVNPSLLTITEDASSVHQVVSTLRHGLAGNRFDTVILVAHSLGSILSVAEAATFHDVSAVALTGMTHFPKLQFLPAIALILKPTQVDGDSILKNRPPGELTIDGPDRARYFYARGDTDPQVLAKDTATRDTVSVGELATFPYYDAKLRDVDAPVLVAMGSEDGAFGCGALVATVSNCPDAAALRASERPYLTRVSTLDTYVQPGSGHDLNLSNHYRPWFDALSSWAARMSKRSG